MALPARFSPLHSDLNDFLVASVGVEQNGMPLSVVSALTRLGADPWEEAARLAALPKALAVETLAPMIARLPIGSTAPVGQPGRHPAVGGPFAGTRADTSPGREQAGAKDKRYFCAVMLLAFLALGAAAICAIP